MWQALSVIVFYLLFMAIVVLLFLIWRENVSRTAKASQALIDVALKNAETSNKSSEAALRSSEAALKAAEAVRILAAQIEKLAV